MFFLKSGLHLMCIFSFLLLIASCKKDELPSPEAKGRDLVYVETNGKKYLYHDGFFTRRSRYVDFLDKGVDLSKIYTQYNRNVTGFRGNRTWDKFTLTFFPHKKNSTFPFYGTAYFFLDPSWQNPIDTVVTSDFQVKHKDQFVDVKYFSEIHMNHFELKNDAILIDMNMVVYHDDVDSIKLGLPYKSKTQSFRLFIDKSLKN